MHLKYAICGPHMLVSLIITFHMYSWIGHLRKLTNLLSFFIDDILLSMSDVVQNLQGRLSLVRDYKMIPNSSGYLERGQGGQFLAVSVINLIFRLYCMCAKNRLPNNLHNLQGYPDCLSHSHIFLYTAMK